MNKSKLQKHVYRHILVVVLLATALTGWPPLASSPRQVYSAPAASRPLASASGRFAPTIVNQPQLFPLWKFNPLASVLPPGIDSYFLNDLGEQGELVITYYPQGVGPANYGVVFGGVLTPMYTAGGQAPGGGELFGMFQAYAASPALVNFSANVDDGGGNVLRYFRWSNGVLTHLPTQANESYDVTMHDAHGKFIFKRTRHWFSWMGNFNCAHA